MRIKKFNENHPNDLEIKKGDLIKVNIKFENLIGGLDLFTLNQRNQII